MSGEPFPESDAGVQAVEDALQKLGEFWESAHIVCTRKDGDGSSSFTDTISRGNGNWSARYGSLKETVIKLEEKMRIDMRRANE